MLKDNTFYTKHSIRPVDENFKPEKYFCDGLSTFEMLRGGSKDLLSNVISRLTKDISTEVSLNNQETHECTSKNIVILKFSECITKFYSCISIAISFFHLLPFFVMQRKKLDYLSKQNKNIKTTILAISARLNNSIIEKNNMRKHLSLLANEFSSSEEGNIILNDIKESNIILLFDPFIQSSLWDHRKQLWAENIFIIDINFVLFVFVTSFYKLGICFFKNIVSFFGFHPLLQLFKRIYKIKLAVCTAITIFGYKEILVKHTDISAYHFTSNSFATEVLRLYLMQNGSCHSICEILHGIPTVEYENYLKKLVDLSNKYKLQDKLSFVAQIPNLPRYGIFNTHNKLLPEKAINTYLNNYIIHSKNTKENFIKFIEDEAKIFTNMPLNNNKLIITIIGGTLATEYKKFFTSESFSIEKYFIKHIKKTLSDKNIPFILIYAPHPLHDWNEVMKCHFFSDEEVFLYRNTIFTWLISDLCFSLYSSAMFEAEFFGAKTFTPLKASDFVYPQKLLGFLNYHKNEERSLDDEITSFILSYNKEEYSDLKERILKRVKKYPFFLKN